MKALNFLNLHDPLARRASASNLAGQKLGMMPKTEPRKESVVAEGIQGAMGGALAGASLAANMGAFDKKTPATSNIKPEPYGDRTAPTIEDKPWPGNTGGSAPANPWEGLYTTQLFQKF